MKVLFITNQFPPLVDGVGDYTYNIAKQFAEHGHEVYVVCKQNPRINTEVNGMTILPIIREWGFHCHQPIVGLIQEKGIEVVSLQYVPHGFHPKGLPFPLVRLVKAIKKCPVRLFTFFHEVCIDYWGWNIKRILCSWGMKYIAKRIIENSDFVATSIEHYVEHIYKLHKGGKVFAIRIASNIPYIHYDEWYLADLRKKIAPNGEFIVLFFGKRNIDCQVNAIQELINEGHKMIALSVGNTYFLKFDYKIPTYKTGLLDINDISQYFQIADCFCLPENEESGATFKSGALAAGLQHGLPIITNKGFMTERTLQHEANIIFTDANNSDAVKKKLLCLMGNKLLAKSIRDNAQLIGDSLTWENTYKCYLKLIHYRKE